MELSHIHLISIVITLCLVMLPGIYASRKIKSADDYNVGGRSAGSFMVAGTIIGTIVGGSATIGTAQLGFTRGLCAWWFTMGSGLALIIMAIFYATPLRNSGLTTISEFLVIKYGKKAGPVSSISCAAGMFFSIVASTITSCNLIAAVFSVDMPSAAVIMVVLVLAIVFFGGISGSGLSGIFKIILIFGTIFVGGIMSYSTLGGLEGMHQAFPEPYWLSLFGNGVEKGLYSLVSMLIGVISTQTYIQALFSAKDSKTAVKGCLLAAVIAIPVGLPSIIIGMFMHLQHPDMLAVNALPIFMLTYLPDWLGGIGIAGLLLTALGSIAGIALGIGTMLSRDIFGALGHITDGRQLLWINRGCVVVALVAGIFVAFKNMSSLILEWNYLSMALRGAGIFLPLTFAVLAPGLINRRFGFMAMVVGVFIALTWKLFVPTAQNTLFPSLAFNLLFLVPGLFLSYRAKHREDKNN